MATDKEAKDIIDKFIDNLFNFDVLTTDPRYLAYSVLRLATAT